MHNNRLSLAVRRLLPRSRQRAVARGYRPPQHPQHLRRVESVGRQPQPEEDQEGGQVCQEGQGSRVL